MASLKEKTEQILNDKNTNLLPENLKEDITVLGVTGTLKSGIDTSSDNPITADDIAEGKEGYVNGEKVIGNAFTVNRNESAIAVSGPLTYDVGGAGQLLINGFAPNWSSGQTSTLFKGGSRTFANIGKEEQSGLANAVGLTPDKLKAGETVLGIEGNFKEDVKLFTTEEEMQNDASAEINDLGVVYSKSLQKTTATSKIRKFIVPETIVLDNPYTSSSYLHLDYEHGTEAMSVYVNIGKTSYSFTYMGMDVSVDVSYRSTDGITYTLEEARDMNNNAYADGLMDLGAEIWLSTEEQVNWIPCIGEFFVSPKYNYSGLCQYRDYADDSKIVFTDLSKCVIGFNGTKIDNVNVSNARNDFIISKSDVYNTLVNNNFYGGYLVADKDKNIYYVTGALFLNQIFSTVDNEIVHTGYMATDGDAETIYKMNFTDNTLTSVATISEFTRINEVGGYYSNGTYLWDVQSLGIDFCTETIGINLASGIVESNGTMGNELYYDGSSYKDIESELHNELINISTDYHHNKYYTVPSDLDAIQEYVMDKTFIGVEGVQQGTLQKTDNLTKEEMRFRVSKLYNNIIKCNLSKDIKNIENMFYLDESITDAMWFDTGHLTNVSSLYNSCTNLVNVPVYDTSNITPFGTSNYQSGMSAMFSNCPNLSDESLNNIMQMCINATKVTVGKTLKQLGISQVQVEKCMTLSNYQALLDAGWTTGY